MILTFDANAAHDLLKASRNSKNRRPVMDQFCNPEFWRDDLDPAKRTQMLEGLEKNGYPSGIEEKDVDPAKIPAGIWLAGDKGVYLMSNAPIEDVRKAGIKHVVYAREVNPETMKTHDWQIAKEASFGGDDGCDFIDEKTLEQALGNDTLKIDITRESMSFVIPRIETPEP